MSEAGKRIYTQIKRVPPEVLMQFKGVPSSNIGDNLNRLYCMDSGMMAMNGRGIVGSAITVKTAPGDNLILYKAFEVAQEGDVLVIDGGGEINRALIGEIMAQYAAKLGLAGIIIDGAVRDVDSLEDIDIGIYARAVTPAGPYKEGPGEINVPISCGAQAVLPGDVIVADGDGIVVVRADDAEAVIQKAIQQMKNENELIRQLNRSGTLEFPWLDDVLKNKNFSIE